MANPAGLPSSLPGSNAISLPNPITEAKSDKAEKKDSDSSKVYNKSKEDTVKTTNSLKPLDRVKNSTVSDEQHINRAIGKGESSTIKSKVTGIFNSISKKIGGDSSDKSSSERKGSLPPKPESTKKPLSMSTPPSAASRKGSLPEQPAKASGKSPKEMKLSEMDGKPVEEEKEKGRAELETEVEPAKTEEKPIEKPITIEQKKAQMEAKVASKQKEYESIHNKIMNLTNLQDEYLPELAKKATSLRHEIKDLQMGYIKAEVMVDKQHSLESEITQQVLNLAQLSHEAQNALVDTDAFTHEPTSVEDWSSQALNSMVAGKDVGQLKNDLSALKTIRNNVDNEVYKASVYNQERNDLASRLENVGVQVESGHDNALTETAIAEGHKAIKTLDTKIAFIQGKIKSGEAAQELLNNINTLKAELNQVSGDPIAYEQKSSELQVAVDKFREAAVELGWNEEDVNQLL